MLFHTHARIHLVTCPGEDFAAADDEPLFGNRNAATPTVSADDGVGGDVSAVKVFSQGLVDPAIELGIGDVIEQVHRRAS